MMSLFWASFAAPFPRALPYVVMPSGSRACCRLSLLTQAQILSGVDTPVAMKPRIRASPICMATATQMNMCRSNQQGGGVFLKVVHAPLTAFRMCMADWAGECEVKVLQLATSHAVKTLE